MRVTMISHSCTLLELGGLNVLTDPWMTEPIYWGKLYHRFGVGLRIEDLPKLDLVLASHGHDDHLDPNTLEQLDRATPVAVLERVAGKVLKLGFQDVRPMVAGSSFELDGLRVTACFGKHPGGIVTYVLEAETECGRESLFFGGDTAYDARLLAIGRDFPDLDVSLLPVSGGRALFGLQHLHMTPEESARVAEGLGTKVAIPFHYHFELRGLPRCLTKRMDVAHQNDEFVRLAPTLCPSVEVVTLDVGQSWTPGKRP